MLLIWEGRGERTIEHIACLFAFIYWYAHCTRLMVVLSEFYFTRHCVDFCSVCKYGKVDIYRVPVRHDNDIKYPSRRILSDMLLEHKWGVQAVVWDGHHYAVTLYMHTMLYTLFIAKNECDLYLEQWQEECPNITPQHQTRNILYTANGRVLIYTSHSNYSTKRQNIITSHPNLWFGASSHAGVPCAIRLTLFAMWMY